jgi:hypothetical protein
MAKLILTIEDSDGKVSVDFDMTEPGSISDMHQNSVTQNLGIAIATFLQDQGINVPLPILESEETKH